MQYWIFTILVCLSLLEQKLSSAHGEIDDDLDQSHYFFRKDYHLDREEVGWFKLHQVPARWHDARRRCEIEGAELATPKNIEIFRAMVLMSKTRPSTNLDGIFTGIHAIFSSGDYYTINGIPLDNLPLKWAPGGPSGDAEKRCVVFFQNGTIVNQSCDVSRPYICYRKYGPTNITQCGTIDEGYTMGKTANTCYKLHPVGIRWRDAAMTCSAEGGHLVVMNDKQEVDDVVHLFRKYSTSQLSGEDLNNIFIGMIDWEKSGQWVTIDGLKLENLPFLRWSPGEPNHINNNEFCGALKRDGGMNDAPCLMRLPFVCEKAIDSLLSPLEISFATLTNPGYGHGVDDTLIPR